MDEPAIAPEILSYHLDELAIARNASDPRRCLPEIEDARVLLDIGCGAGQTLEALASKALGMKVGVDIDLVTLKIGRRLFPQLFLVCGSGEALPFRDGEFDLVLSRVAVPYMRFPASVNEMYRVTRGGGRIWLSLHPFRLARDRTIRAMKSLNIKSFMYALYVLVNGTLLHFIGRTISFPLRRLRHESFQTSGGMTRVLSSTGYTNIAIRNNQHLVIQGRRVVR